MNELDDFLCERQSDEYDEDSFWFWSDESSRAAFRRKNEWKYAKRNQRIVESMGGCEKPLHYYAKTAPEYYYQRCNKTNNKGKHRTAYGNYNPPKNWGLPDKRQIDDFENQMEELYKE